MSHPLTTTLTLLLVAEQMRPGRGEGDFEYDVHDVIERLVDLADWSDYRKADLYALLVESIEETDSMIVMQKKVAAALRLNHGRFLNG